MDYREYGPDMYRRDGYPEGWGRERRSVDYEPRGRVVERYRVRRNFEGFGGRPDPDRWRDRSVEGWRPEHGDARGGDADRGWHGWVGGEGFAPRGREGGWERGFEDEWRGRERSGTIHREYGGREFQDPPRDYGPYGDERGFGGRGFGRQGHAGGYDGGYRSHPTGYESYRHDHPGYTGGRPSGHDFGRCEPDWEERYQAPSYFDDRAAPRWRDGYGAQGGETRQVGYGRFGVQPRSEGAFSGRGPRGYRRADERIREDVCDRLCDHPGVDASEVDVSIRDGEITLQGSVPDRWMKRLAEDLAEGVQGVNQVHNHLRVAQPGSETQASPVARSSAAPARSRTTTGV